MPVFNTAKCICFISLFIALILVSYLFLNHSLLISYVHVNIGPVFKLGTVELRTLSVFNMAKWICVITQTAFIHATLLPGLLLPHHLVGLRTLSVFNMAKWICLIMPTFILLSPHHLNNHPRSLFIQEPHHSSKTHLSLCHCSDFKDSGHR